VRDIDSQQDAMGWFLWLEWAVNAREEGDAGAVLALASHDAAVSGESVAA
jgi:hypothetical protein